MGSTCSARVEVCPSSRAAQEGVPGKIGPRSQAGGDRGIPPLRLRSGQALAQKTRKNGPPGVPCKTGSKSQAGVNQQRKSTAAGEGPFGFAQGRSALHVSPLNHTGHHSKR